MQTTTQQSVTVDGWKVGCGFKVGGSFRVVFGARVESGAQVKLEAGGGGGGGGTRTGGAMSIAMRTCWERASLRIPKPGGMGHLVNTPAFT